MHKITKSLLLVTGTLGILALASMRVFDEGKPEYPGASPRVKHAAEQWNEQAIDTAVSMLQTGNVVVCMGNGAYSHLLAQMNRHNKSYSHCGLVLIENGYPFVYHSIGGEENPDARLRRDSARQFFSQAHNTAIGVVRYGFTDVEQKALDTIVKDYYSKRPKFDLQFDLSTDDKLYCTEFVYKAITAATHDTAYLPTTTVTTHRFVGTDNLIVNSHAQLVWQVKFK